MKATDYWKQRFGEEPKSTTDKLACAMMSEYGREQWNDALDAAYALIPLEINLYGSNSLIMTANIHGYKDSILKLKK
jgi:hypothetical protein